jgi:hypothetical protein
MYDSQLMGNDITTAFQNEQPQMKKDQIIRK